MNDIQIQVYCWLLHIFNIWPGSLTRVTSTIENILVPGCFSLDNLMSSWPSHLSHVYLRSSHFIPWKQWLPSFLSLNIFSCMGRKDFTITSTTDHTVKIYDSAMCQKFRQIHLVRHKTHSDNTAPKGCFEVELAAYRCLRKANLVSASVHLCVSSGQF